MTDGASTILVVGGGLFQLGVIRAARKLGVKVAVVDRNADAPGMALADHPLAIDTADASAVTAAARRLGVAGVLTAASDVAVGAVASVVDALGLPGVGSEVAARCRDKLATFECLHRHGLATPRALKIANLAQAEAHVAELGGYPIVVKPRSSAGGRGVWVVTGREQLEAAIARAQSYAAADGSVLLQQFARGLSVGAEAVFWRSELVACFVLDDQYQDGFVSPVGHSLPCSLPEATQAQVRDAVARYGAALGIECGPANFDLRLSDEGVSLIEVNMRLGGNSITEVVELAYGVDLSAAAVSAAFGRDPSPLLQPTRSQPAAARLILRRGDGVVRMRRQHADCAALAGVVKLDLSVVPGERAAMRVDEWALLGRCITRADRPDLAARLAERIALDAAAAIELDP